MKIYLTLEGVPAEVELLAPAPACRFRFDGEERTAGVEVVEGGVYSIVMDGRHFEARVEDGAVFVNGHRFAIEIDDPRSWSRNARGGHGEGVQTIAAPMPGKVVRVLVAVGDTVEAGQGLVVVEAMKMQNELKAPRAGQVLTVTAAEGATVTAGEALATIA